MDFWQEFLQSISQPPGSFVYHTVSLFALQVSLGLAWWQARQRPDDRFIWRVALAAGGILAARLLLFLTILLVSEATLVSLLPPLESAINAISVAALVWALVPHPPAYPRLGNVALVVLLVVVALMYTFFAQDWSASLQEGIDPRGYGLTSAARIWQAFQGVLLAAGSLLIAFWRPSQWFSRVIVLVLFLGAAIAELFPAPVTVGSAPEWHRLAYLFALPLLAVLVYRHGLSRVAQIAVSRSDHSPALLHFMRQAGTLAGQDALDGRLVEALRLVDQLLGPAYAACALPLGDLEDQLQVFGHVRAAAQEEDPQPLQPSRWVLRRQAWPALNSALSRGEIVELVPDGVGARQLHALYQELSVDGAGPLLVLPLTASDRATGLLLLASPVGETWGADDRRLAESFANFLGPLVQEARIFDTESEFSRLRAAEAAAKRAQRQIRQLEAQLRRTEHESGQLPDKHFVAQLEQARLRVRQLEGQLKEIGPGQGQAILSRARELRAPLSALRSYADLLQTNGTGQLNSRQASLVGRIDANVNQLGAMIDDLVNLAQKAQQFTLPYEAVDVRQAVEAAARQSTGALRDKGLDLVIDLEEHLPAVPAPEASLVLLVNHALLHACQVSDRNSQVRVSGHLDRLSQLNVNEQTGTAGFLQLDITDSGGDRSQEIHALLRQSRRKPDDRALQGVVATAGQHLTRAEDLVERRGGRLWVHGAPGAGSTLSILIPLAGKARSPE